MKTNAVRILEEAGIGFELREYEVDPEDLSAASVAGKIGLPLEQVFKTLVVRGDRNGVCLAVVPGDAEVNFKALARLTRDRKMEMVALKEVQPLTGYIRGGVTALACKKPYPVYLDETAILFDRYLGLGRSERIADSAETRRLYPDRERSRGGNRRATLIKSRIRGSAVCSLNRS